MNAKQPQPSPNAPPTRVAPPPPPKGNAMPIRGEGIERLYAKRQGVFEHQIRELALSLHTIDDAEDFMAARNAIEDGLRLDSQLYDDLKAALHGIVTKIEAHGESYIAWKDDDDEAQDEEMRCQE